MKETYVDVNTITIINVDNAYVCLLSYIWISVGHGDCDYDF